MRTIYCTATPIEPPKIAISNMNIILVEPKVPGNIGAVLRCSANFNAAGVRIVAPRCDPYDSDVYRYACDSPLLQTLQVVPSLKIALQDQQTSIAFTRRAGRGRVTNPSLSALLAAFPSLLPLFLQQESFADNNSSSENAALVFGREESGLTDLETAMCAHACAIPSSAAFPSLNLSHAVAVVLSTLFEMGLSLEKKVEIGSLPRNLTESIASQGEIEALLVRAVALMDRAGLDTRESSGGGDKSNHGRRRRPAGHLRALLTRSQASTSEVRAMHGVLKEIERRMEISSTWTT